MDLKFERHELALGMEINDALVNKDADKIISAITQYMLHFELAADERIVRKIPTKI